MLKRSTPPRIMAIWVACWGDNSGLLVSPDLASAGGGFGAGSGAGFGGAAVSPGDGIVNGGPGKCDGRGGRTRGLDCDGGDEEDGWVLGGGGGGGGGKCRSSGWMDIGDLIDEEGDEEGGVHN